MKYPLQEKCDNCGYMADLALDDEYWPEERQYIYICPNCGCRFWTEELREGNVKRLTEEI